MDKVGVNNLVNKYFDYNDKNKDNKINLKDNLKSSIQDNESKFVVMQYNSSAKNEVVVTTTDQSDLFKKADLNGDGNLTKGELNKFITDNYDKGNKGYLSGSKTSKIPIISMFIDSKDGEIDKFNKDFKPKITTKTVDISDIPKDKRNEITNYREGG